MTNPTVCLTGSPVAINESVYVLAGKFVVFRLYWYSGPTSLLDMNVKLPLGCAPGAGLGETGFAVSVKVMVDDDRFVPAKFCNCTLIGIEVPLFDPVVWLYFATTLYVILSVAAPKLPPNSVLSPL